MKRNFNFKSTRESKDKLTIPFLKELEASKWNF